MKDVNVLITFLVLCLTILGINGAGYAIERSLRLRMIAQYLVCAVYAPEEAMIGETFSVEFVIEPRAILNVKKICVKVYGNIGSNGEWGSWNRTWNDMVMYDDTEYRTETSFLVKSIQHSVGIVYIEIWADYTAFDEKDFSFADCEIMRIYTKTHQNLEDEYSSLNETCNNLEDNIQSLQSNLNLSQKVTIALTVSTAILAGITTYLLWKRTRSTS